MIIVRGEPGLKMVGLEEVTSEHFFYFIKLQESFKLIFGFVCILNIL